MQEAVKYCDYKVQYEKRGGLLHQIRNQIGRFHKTLHIWCEKNRQTNATWKDIR